MSLAGEKKDGQSGWDIVNMIQEISIEEDLYIQCEVERISMRRDIASTTWIPIHKPSSAYVFVLLINDEFDTVDLHYSLYLQMLTGDNGILPTVLLDLIGVRDARDPSTHCNDLETPVV